MRRVNVSCVLFLLSLALFGSVVNAKSVTIDNNGKARKNPYGDSKLQSSLKNAEYYDCYIPYKTKIRDIGGHAISYTAPQNVLYGYSMSDYAWKIDSTCFSYLVNYEKALNSSTFHGSSVSVDSDTGLYLLTDKHGNQYFMTAVQDFFFNSDKVGSKGFLPSTGRGQIIDVILTDGTVAHFIMADSNATCHTNGGPASTFDVIYTFAELKLSQYKNMFQAACGNMLEVWGPSKTCAGNLQKKLGLSEDGNKIAYYRVYNKTLDDAPERAKGVGKGAITSFGKATISNTSSEDTEDEEDSDDGVKISSAEIVSEMELRGMPDSFKISDSASIIELPDGSELTVDESMTLADLRLMINEKKEDSFYRNLRILIVFLGLCMIVYALVFMLSWVFDRVNTFIDISALGLITLGRLKYNESKYKMKGYVGDRGVLLIVIVCVVVGLFIISGEVFSVVEKLVLLMKSL